jgi:simple sugar transport system ATP-binding protein
VAVEGLSKRFGSVQALDGAELVARSGEVHALLGENGAGKTTLLSILAGLRTPDTGTIRVDGGVVTLPTARSAWRRGIGLVHQHFALVGRMTVLENLALGRRTSAHGLGLGMAGLRRRAGQLAGETGLDVPLDARVEELGVGDRQRAEILKVLLRDPGILILDEPTAVLAPSEVDRLLALLRRLADEGRAVLLVAHKLDEVLRVGDAFTVLRQGRTVLQAPRADVDAETLADAMVGSADVAEAAAAGDAAAPPDGVGSPPPAGHPGRVVAHLHGVRVAPTRGGAGLDDADLELREGEIVGIAGVEGNGQRELALILSGRVDAEAGRVETPRDPAFIPQDRSHEGLVGGFTVTENLALRLQRDPAFRLGPLMRWPALRAAARDAIRDYGIRTPGPGTPVGALSGGNQQRVVVARELHGTPTLIVAENPTRGLDVAGAAFVHETLRERARPGGAGPAAAVALISTDLDEILSMSDRIFVLVRGRLTEVPAHEQSREGVGRRMLAGGDARAGGGA